MVAAVVAGFQPARQIERQPLVGIADAGIDGGDFAPLARGVAGFLFQFPLRTGEVILAGIDLAGRQFDEIAVQRIAVLAFQQQVAVVEYRNDDNGAGMDDVLAGRFAAVGQAHAVALDVHQPSLEDGLALQSGFGKVGGIVFHGRRGQKNAGFLRTRRNRGFLPLVAENFLPAAQAASQFILRRGSGFGYTTLVVGAR
ncbi:MAG: hypothetical protein ABS89_08740 [Thiobacillus sp. SCN 63-1177]|nr:MAG: hypothetical protein ABS89_08740 [Thiobacillus sp. SCN 63-1177]